MLAGPSGSGRTVLALQLAAAALDNGRVVSLLCNEPAPFLLQQASTLGFDLAPALESERLALLEMDAEIASITTALGAEALIDAIKQEQPLTSLLVIDPFSVITASIFDEAQLRACARAFVAAAAEWAVVLTIESERLALQHGLERVLCEVCGSFATLHREPDGVGRMVVGKTRTGLTGRSEAAFTIGIGGTRPLAEPADIEEPAAPGFAEATRETMAPAREIPREPEPAEDAKPQRTGLQTILLVDSDRASRNQLSKWLDGRYEVITADDGFEAMTWLMTRSPDLVVLDLLMPRVNGYELLSAFQRTNQSVPRLVISSRIRRPGDRLAPLILGASDVLAKPLERFEFLHKVEMLLRLDEAPAQKIDAIDAESLFATISKTRQLSLSDFHLRLERACRLGERLALPSSLVAVSAASSATLDHFLATSDDSLRFEDATLRASQRRAVYLLVATECADAPAAIERLCSEFEQAGGIASQLDFRISDARRLDDGYDEHLLAAQMMAKHGFSGTAYIIPDSIGQQGYLTQHQLVDLQLRYGWDIAAHHEESFTELRPDELENVIMGVQRFLIENDFRSGAAHLAYPLGRQNTSIVQPLVRKHFATARVAASGPETLPPADPHLLRVFNVTPETTPELIGAATTRARENKEWLILMLHYLVERPENNLQYSIRDFERMLAELVKSKIRVLPLTKVWEACGRDFAGPSPDSVCSFDHAVAAPKP